MTEIITFERDPDQRWYAVVPLWEGERDALEMVAGADVMLGILSKGDDRITLKMSEEEFEGYTIKLGLVNYDAFDGAYYNVNSDTITNMLIWLCGVTEFVFGHYPGMLYCKKV